MRRNVGLLLGPPLLIAAALLVACGGGDGNDRESPRDLAEVPTATLPESLPEPVIVGPVTPQPGAGVGEQTYVVQPDDIPETIAAQFDITAEELMAANGIIDPTTLFVGQELIIPSGAGPAGQVAAATEEPPPSPPAEPPPPEQQVHIVQAGEIPETIAALYGITSEELMAANGIIDPASLFIGQELVIPAPAQ